MFDLGASSKEKKMNLKKTLAITQLREICSHLQVEKL